MTERVNDIPTTVALVREAALQPAALIDRTLSYIAERDSAIRAWSHIGAPDALQRAAEAVDHTARLAGVPFGVKDVLNVADMPTRFGARLLFRGDEPFDAACVTRLRSAGAIPIGKTVTAEFAYKQPGLTVNPYDPSRTPGGSSSGSAAAVAAGMVPFALGTQTGGSIIRPAAFCGVAGFKPTFGAVERDGMKVVCESLDTIGWYAQSVCDLRSIAAELLSEEPTAEPARPPKVALALNYLHILDPDAREVLNDVVRLLREHGALCADISVADDLTQLASAHQVIMQYELARSIAPIARRHAEHLSETLLKCVKRGQETDHAEYMDARAFQREMADQWRRVAQGADFVLTPSVPGEAPRGLTNTGSSAFNVAWSVLGWPCLHLPHGLSRNGMPLGVQLVGQRGSDMDLLGWGKWLERVIFTSRLRSGQQTTAF
ncbi:amidase [Paraburkholderia sp. SIMBA_053]|uniref:amidase n=1 Tax=Paraburkholderia sp. SIMBA_053 TaxID=3085794 RepID=UPI00397BB787